MTAFAKRLAPTRETVRRLYLLSGNQCAFPECSHPIIIEDGTYVGDLCHICAAEEGGERFDQTQTNEDRRQFENLMLMCHNHHVVTNDVAAYPVSRMRQVKADHERRFERGLASMIESASIQISGSIVAFGGEAGKTPGAGGGGGGAVGPGAKAGDGGPGGRTVDAGLLDVAKLMETLGIIAPGVPKGGGGGGAPAIGPNATAGDGGGGGDLHKSTLDAEMLRRLNIVRMAVRVGQGGRADEDGQPTGYDLIDDRDNIIVSVNAPSGKGGHVQPSHNARPSHRAQAPIWSLRLAFSALCWSTRLMFETISYSFWVVGGLGIRARLCRRDPIGPLRYKYSLEE